jgi:Protein of unknown function (DUF4232)
MSSSTIGATSRPATGVGYWLRRLSLASGLALAVAACTGTATPTPIASVAGATATPSASAAPSATAVASATATPAATPTPTPTPTAPSTPKPTPKVTPLPPLAIGLCTGAQLKLTLDYWIGSSGNPSYAHVHATNVSSASCNMRGTPRSQVVDGHGHAIVDSGNGGSEVKTTDTVYTLAPNGVIYDILEWDNWCKSSPTQKVTVGVYLPFGLGHLVAKANGNAPIAYCSSSSSKSTVLAEKWLP